MDWNSTDQFHKTRHEEFSLCSNNVSNQPILMTSSMLKILGSVSKERS